MLREPPKGPLYARAEVYRARAEELRIIAEDMHCGETRRVCLSIAAGYERLACQVETMLPTNVTAGDHPSILRAS